MNILNIRSPLCCRTASETYHILRHVQSILDVDGPSTATSGRRMEFRILNPAAMQEQSSCNS